MAKCPYCEKQVVLKASGGKEGSQVRKEITGFVKKEVMYSCPHCDCILGFAFYLGGRLTGRP